MSTPREQARNGLLLDGLGKPLDLNAIDWHIRRQNRGITVGNPE